MTLFLLILVSIVDEVVDAALPLAAVVLLSLSWRDM